MDSIAVEQEGCTAAVAKNVLFDASQVVLYNLVVRMVQKARKLRGCQIAKCSSDSVKAE